MQSINLLTFDEIKIGNLYFIKEHYIAVSSIEELITSIEVAPETIQMKNLTYAVKFEVDQDFMVVEKIQKHIEPFWLKKATILVNIIKIIDTKERIGFVEINNSHKIFCDLSNQ
jgi:hypothetical protein